MNRWLHILWFLFLTSPAFSQDSTEKPKQLTVNGYIKTLQSLNFNKNFKELVAGNLLHNRLNLKYKPPGKFSVTAEIRNRLFWGEEVKTIPGFDSLLRNDNEKINMQKVWITNHALVLHSNVERLFIDYRGEDFQLRLGRQRINWGITTTWNPNDIFNTYNFLDYDYEERPGVDGAKFHYSASKDLNAELAYANTGKKNGHIAAIKYAFNKWNYDMQLITGWYRNQITLGAGWAGYIKDAGFKGEAQYFFGKKDTASRLNLSLEGDYMFKNGWYVNLGLLLNNHGLYKPLTKGSSIDLTLSPGNLMPTKYNIILTTAKEFTPLLSANVSLLYAPGTNLLILFPTFQYNMATNLDVTLVWQSFFAEQDDQFEALNHRCLLRLKWSF